MYFDARGDCRWRMLPWDKDFTFGVLGDGGTYLPHPFFGDEEHKKQNANQWNILYDIIFEEEVTQRIYLRRLRTLMDDVLQPTSVPTNDRILENLALDTIGPASPPLSSNINSVNSYLNSRRIIRSFRPANRRLPTSSSQPSMPTPPAETRSRNTFGSTTMRTPRSTSPVGPLKAESVSPSVPEQSSSETATSTFLQAAKTSWIAPFLPRQARNSSSSPPTRDTFPTSPNCSPSKTVRARKSTPSIRPTIPVTRNSISPLARSCITPPIPTAMPNTLNS